MTGDDLICSTFGASAWNTKNSELTAVLSFPRMKLDLGEVYKANVLEEVSMTFCENSSKVVLEFGFVSCKEAGL